jgi:hypothetical protein
VFKRAAKIFAILAAMTVTVNAQCALACLFQAAQQPKQEAHSCCNAHKSSASHKPERCSEPSLTLASVEKSQSVPFYAVVHSYVPFFALTVHHSVRPLTNERLAIPDIPAFSILRI